MNERYSEEWLANRLAKQGAAKQIVVTEKKVSKYRSQATEVDNIVFASRKEARRYQELTLLQRVGKISNLTMQVKFSLDVDGVHICNYIADFCYDENDQVVVEDCKGIKTPAYRLKAKLMMAVYRIKIFET